MKSVESIYLLRELIIVQAPASLSKINKNIIVTSLVKINHIHKCPTPKLLIKIILIQIEHFEFTQ